MHRSTAVIVTIYSIVSIMVTLALLIRLSLTSHDDAIIWIVRRTHLAPQPPHAPAARRADGVCGRAVNSADV